MLLSEKPVSLFSSSALAPPKNGPQWPTHALRQTRNLITCNVQQRKNNHSQHPGLPPVLKLNQNTIRASNNTISPPHTCPMDMSYYEYEERQILAWRPIVVINWPLIPKSAASTMFAPLKCRHQSSPGPRVRKCRVDVSRAGIMRFWMELRQATIAHNRVSCFHKWNSWDPRRRWAKRRRRKNSSWRWMRSRMKKERRKVKMSREEKWEEYSTRPEIPLPLNSFCSALYLDKDGKNRK